MHAGFMFACSDQTQGECFDKLLFGLPESNFKAMKGIGPDTAVFLLNFKTRQVYGVFQPAGEAAMNIDAGAWQRKYPAQIRVKWADIGSGGGQRFAPVIYPRPSNVGRRRPEGAVGTQEVEALLRLLVEGQETV